MCRSLITAFVLLAFIACKDAQIVEHGDNPALGQYSGPFLGGPLSIRVDSMRGDSVFGMSSHKSEVRALKGIMRRSEFGDRIMLWEPGDSPYDGMFEVRIDTVAGTLSGIWRPNNSELDNAIFDLRKQVR